MTRYGLTLTGMTLAALIAACGGGAGPADTTAVTAGPATTSTVGATTVTSTLPAVDLGYPVSNEWVVETVARDIDGGTGGLAVDEDGVIYMGDFGYATNTGSGIYRITPDGQVDVFSSADRMEQLTTTKFGPDGILYQSSYGSNRVFRVDQEGDAVVVTEDIRGPTGLVILDDGTLVVASWSQGIIHKVRPDGAVEDWVGPHPGFNGINSLTVDPDGTIYVVNIRDGGLFSIDEAGQVTEMEFFPRANSHVAYLDGSLFVTSRGGYVIYRYDLESGKTEVVAGNGEPGDQDGRGIESSFGRPNAIAVGPEGALYFNHAEGRNDTPVHIKKLTHQP